MKEALLLLVVLWLVSLDAQRVRVNIVDFGAVGDGTTLCTPAIVKAVDAASQVSGGANVYVPAGTFLVGQFSLVSHVYLEVAEGGELYATDDATQYKCIPSVTSDTGPCNYPLLHAENATDISVLGPGIINGGANDPPGHLVASFNATTDFLTPTQWNLPNCSGYNCRPKLVVFTNVNKLSLLGIKLFNSPLWTTTLIQCRDVLVDGVTIMGDRRWPNNDGIDPVDSSDIIIQNSVISVGDDGICVVVHTPEPCSNITVRNMTISSSSAALKLGVGDKDASGDIYDITFENVTITDTNRGLCFMPRWGTGNIYNITFANIDMQTRYFSPPWWGSAEPIYVTSMSLDPDQPWTGIVSNVVFRDITAVSENGVIVYAETKPINGIVFERVKITISQFTNYSFPSHDWRPAPFPDRPYAPTNALFMQNVNDVLLQDSVFNYAGTVQSFWGPCINASGLSNVTENNFSCNGPKG